ncbi:MAG: hypothetical protein AAGU19_04935 [Prolixibacteraceae bacterium]
MNKSNNVSRSSDRSKNVCILEMVEFIEIKTDFKTADFQKKVYLAVVTENGEFICILIIDNEKVAH